MRCSARLFFFNDTATTEIYTLSLHDALPISRSRPFAEGGPSGSWAAPIADLLDWLEARALWARLDRKSTRLKSSHLVISYAVFCLKKNNPSARNLPSDRGCRAAHRRLQHCAN